MSNYWIDNRISIANNIVNDIEQLQVNEGVKDIYRRQWHKGYLCSCSNDELNDVLFEMIKIKECLNN